MKRAPTLNDVAELAKVSRSLASLVFQDSPKVSATSRAAVLKAADKLGYQPNESARRLKSSVTNTIGVVLTDIHNPYYGGIFYGIESAASELDYKLLIGNSGFESDELNQKPERIRSRQLDTLRIIRSQMVDGIICSSLRTTPQELRAAAKTSPVVLIGHSSNTLLKDFDIVVTDEQNGAAQVIDHLTDFGHKRISHISGGVDEGPAVRTKSFLNEMKRRGLSQYAKVYEGAWSQEAGYTRTGDILNEKTLPTAIFAGNDLIAMGVLARLQEAGLKVPTDISVIGFNDSALAQLRISDLTSVKEPLFIMGRTGFEILISRIENKGKKFVPKNVKIKPELVVRSSTGPRKKGAK
ncbi:LacI family DNA-binding transcriptional regulator [Candidatus Planktophila dulcis]|uniref:LacI family DNA-binding transcriptional regulator n=1 Tax=Candidatus Planktophila dulcis TaxID=1884914 RepID=UPI003CF7BF41